MTMTYAAVPALADSPYAETWLPKLTARDYDPAVAPVATKRAATLGMAMTEKQGGSDVRANTTRAEADGDAYRLTGHKWFCSAPMSDGFLTLAQAPGGLTCFLVPRWLEGGRNAIHLMRLKDKLGNRASASTEIEYHGALAHRLGAEGQGVRTILQIGPPHPARHRDGPRRADARGFWPRRSGGARGAPSSSAAWSTSR